MGDAYDAQQTGLKQGCNATMNGTNLCHHKPLRNAANHDTIPMRQTLTLTLKSQELSLNK